MGFNYQQLKNTITLQHLYLPMSRRLMTFLSYDGDLWHWAITRWNDSNKVYNSCKGYPQK